MPSVSYPGFYFTEQGGLPVISSPSPSIGAFEGYTKRGLIGELGFISSWSSFVRQYGDTFTSSVVSEMMTPHCVKQFFDNGGNACWINRIEGAAATTASTTLLNLTGAGTLVTVSAVGSGEGGTQLGIASTKQTSEIVTVAGWGAATAAIEVTSVSGFEQGDIIFATDGVNLQYATVYNIDLASSELDITASGLAVVVAAGNTIQTVSRHRCSTTLSAGIGAADTSVPLTDASRLSVGSIIIISDGTNEIIRSVSSKSGNTVVINAAAGAIFAPGTGCWSQEFNLEVHENDAAGVAQLLETHYYLNVSSASEDYIVTRIAGTDNESVLISTVIGAGATAVAPFTLIGINPIYTQAAQALSTAGADAAASAAEWEGASAATGKTGLYVFDDAASGAINFFSLPDVGADVAAVTLAADTYAQLRKDLMFIAHAPSDDEYVAELLDYRKYTLGLDSSYTALYAPWVD